MVKRMKEENPFITDKHFKKVREIESEHIKRDNAWKKMNKTLEEIPAGRGLFVQSNGVLKEAGQEITQEKNTDAIVLNQAKNTQKTA